jgi:hypothetical protein
MIEVCRSPVTRWAVMPMIVAIGLMVSGTASAGAATHHFVAVSGSGSSWAGLAVDLWR